MALALVRPNVSLVNRNADQVRHHVRQSEIVIAFDPNYFNLSLGIGEFADAGEELPMIAGQPAEIQVGEDVSKEYQSPIR